MRNGFFLLESVLMISTIIITSCLVYPFSKNYSVENYLTMFTDRKVYFLGDTMNVTVKNILSENIVFATYYFSIIFERWNGTAWQYYTSFKEPQGTRTLPPSAEGRVTFPLSASYFVPGRYRTVTGGYIGELYGESTYAYAEFEVQEVRESKTLVVLTVTAIVIVGIAAAYLVKKRVRG